MGKYSKYEMPGQYQNLYNVLNGADFSDINSFGETAMTAFSTLQANLQGIQGALGRESTWDDSACGKLVTSFDEMNTSIASIINAVPGKCSGASGSLSALASAIVRYKEVVDDYNNFVQSYTNREGSEPLPATKKVTTTSGSGAYATTSSHDEETDNHKKWREELAKLDVQIAGAMRTIKETESQLNSLITKAKSDCGPM